MVSFTQATLAVLGLATAASAAPTAVAAPFRPAGPGRRDLEPRRAKITPKVMIVSLVSTAFVVYQSRHARRAPEASLARVCVLRRGARRARAQAGCSGVAPILIGANPRPPPACPLAALQFAPERATWVEELELVHNTSVPLLSPLFPKVACNEAHEICICECLPRPRAESRLPANDEG